MKLKSLLLILLLLCVIGTGCTPAPTAQIAATTLPVYEFTVRLCQGTDITVVRLVTENISCLHDYSLNVSQVRAVESAEVVVLSGAGLEEFIEDVTCKAALTIDASAGIEILGCGEAHDHDHNDDHHHHDGDPHIWLSPANAKVMAENICRGLSARYPQHADIFEENLTLLLADLDDLQAYGEKELADLSCRELITFHDGFTYLAHAFDLHIVEAVEEESGSEASARELIHLIELTREHRLPAIFTETNGSTSAATVIAVETGAALYSLDMAMSGDSYFEAMYHNIDTLKEALG